MPGRMPPADGERRSPPADAGAGAADIERIFRAEFGRLVATLIRRFGDIDLAEEMAQESFVEALRRWPDAGLPPNPGAWLTTTARNRAIDRLRRESTRDARHQEADMLHGPSSHDPVPVTSVTDDRLRLLFTCCHPALAVPAQVALTLRLLGGLTVPEIAEAFLVPERTMAQRITRAKAKIKAANIPYRAPHDADLPQRLSGVLATVYLIFNEGYLPSAGGPVLRVDLSSEAIRLGGALRDLMPDEPEVAGLLAMMLLIESRRAARVADGVLVPLDQQDRSRWDRTLIAEGHALVRWCLQRGRPGPYQLLAAINAVHTDAATFAETAWTQVVALYDQLSVAMPTPVVALNRAVAIAEIDGPATGLALIDGLPLDGYHPFHATRADLLRRLGDRAGAASAYDRALELATNPAERAFLEARRVGAG